MKSRIGIVIAFAVVLCLLVVVFSFQGLPLKIKNDIVKHPLNFDKAQKRIVFVSPQYDFPVWLQAKKGFDDAAKEFGFHGSWVGGGNCNIDDMLRELDIAMAEKADAVLTCPLNPSKFTEKFAELNQADIPVITIAVDAERETLRTSFIGSNYQELGLLQVQALHKKVGDNLNIGIIMSNLDTNNQLIQISAMKEYIKSIPNAKIVAVEEDWSDPVIGISVLTKMLDEHPEINAIFGTEGGGVSGFAKVVRDRGLSGKLTIVGMDIIEANLQTVRDGWVYGVMSQDFYKMGYLGGKYAYEKSLGKDVPSCTYTETLLVTKENVSEIKSVDAQ